MAIWKEIKKSINSNLSTPLNSLIGLATDISSASTLFGRIQKPVYAGTTQRGATDSASKTVNSSATLFNQEIKRYRIPVSGAIKVQFDGTYTAIASSALLIMKNARTGWTPTSTTTVQVNQSPMLAINISTTNPETLGTGASFVLSGLQAGDEISFVLYATNTGASVTINNVKFFYDALSGTLGSSDNPTTLVA